MRKVRTLAVTLLVLIGILFLWKTTDPQETAFGAPRDAILAVGDPAFRDAGNVTISDNYMVIGVAINGEAKAYPVIILDWHEIVNDELGGVPVVVTYCPLCGSGIVFDRRVGDATLTFGVSGLLYRNDLVMYDRQTDSQWVQILGEAIRGPMRGSHLDLISSRTVQWGAWRELWPESQFMEFPTLDRDYGLYPYGDYRESESVSFPREFRDDTLRAKEVVLGVELGDSAVAYPASTLREERVVNDAIDGLPVVVTYYNDAMAIFRRGNESLSFSDGFYMEDGSGDRWNMVTGRGEAGGGNEGARLDEVEHVTSYWFAWLDFHPNTTIYGADGEAREGMGLLGSYWALLLAAVVALLAPALHHSRWMRARALRESSWIDFSRSHLYGGGAVVLGLLVALFGVGDLRWTNLAASMALGAASVGLGAYLVAERWKLGRYSGRFTGVPMEEAAEGIAYNREGGGGATEKGDATVWPRTPGRAYDLSGETVILADDWAYAQTSGPGRRYLGSILWWEEEE